MSLINDALKRASQSDRARPAQAALPRPLQPAVEPKRSSRVWLIVGIAAALAGLVLAAWFLWQSLGVSHSSIATAPGQPTQMASAEHSPDSGNSPVLLQKNPPSTGIASDSASSAPAPPAVVAPPPPPDPDAWLTNLTVKAIFYSKTNPRALVNGMTVQTGDSVEGVLVTGILTDRIFVDWKGTTREIMLK